MRSNNGLVRFGSKSFILTAAIIIILGCTISGTVAWMFVKAEPAINTFTYGGIKIELIETDTKDDDEDENTNSYSFTPEAVIAKDPLVTVAAGQESCWLFVEVVESDNFDEFMEYQMDDGWKALNGYQNQSGWDAEGNAIVSNIYYRQVAAADSEQTFPVLKDNVVAVLKSVSQSDLDALKEEDYPTLDFTAYAVQQEAVDTASVAWELIEK